MVRVVVAVYYLVLLSGLREASTAGGPTAVINSSILGPGFVRRRTARVGDRGDGDLATSLALRDGLGEGGPARGQGPRD